MIGSAAWGGHPQTLTPNLDRLAKSGVLFTNAHCAAAACNPSRTAIFTGVSPHRSGIYSNSQSMRQLLPDAELIPKTFSRHGYHASGSGKMLHYFIDAPSWDEYFPDKSTENPFPRTLYPDQRPVGLPRGGDWQYGGDYLVTQWIAEQLVRQQSQPFFLACGIYRPHEPWFVPQQYFEPFPLESIQLPPGYRADDLDDLPPEGKRRGPNQFLDHIRQQGQWKRAIQAYLASIHFADAMLGRVLDALESCPHADNTIVVLWSDHGWHLAGLPAQSHHDAPSIVPLLADSQADWPHQAITYLADPGSLGLSSRGWRLIQYANGDQELYDISSDPYEWHNLAELPEHQQQREALRQLLPKEFAPLRTVDIDQLPVLALQPLPESAAELVSSPRGIAFSLVFDNQTDRTLTLIWVGPNGARRPLGTVAAGQQTAQRTRQGVCWVIEDETGQSLGVVDVDCVAGKVTLSAD